MGQEIADRITPFTRQELLDSLAAAWPSIVGSPCTNADSLRVLAAQICLECGNGAHCHGYNLGNAKATVTGKYDYAFFRCDEVIGGKIVWFDPPNPACCFRAFESLTAGVLDYLAMMFANGNFKRAWPAVISGDPAQFCRLLRQANYYTADEGQYTRAVVSIFGDLRSLVPSPPSKNEAVACEMTYRDLLLIPGDCEDL